MTESNANVDKVLSNADVVLPKVDEGAPGAGVVPPKNAEVPIVREDVPSCVADVLPETCRKYSFRERLDRLFAQIGKKIFYFDEMIDLARNGPEDANADYFEEYFRRAADGLVDVCSEVDIRVREYYLPILKHLFMGVDDQNDAMRYVYGLKCFEQSTPALRDYYENFDTEISAILKNVVQEEDSTMEDLDRQLGFLFMISPKPAIRQILLHCFEETKFIPKMVELLVRFPAFCELRILKPQYKSVEKEPLMFPLYRQFLSFDSGLVKMNNEENRDTMQAIMRTFTSTSFGFSCPTSIPKPLLDATEFLQRFLMDYLTKEYNVDLLLLVLCDMLNIEKTSKCVIRWKKPEDQATPGDSIDPCALFSLLVDIFLNCYDKFDSRDVVAKSIQCLALRLREEMVVLPDCKFLNGKLAVLDWSVKYCVYKWMSPAVVIYRLEVPRILFDVLGPFPPTEYAPLETSVRDGSLDEMDEFLQAIFHLGLISAKESLAFVRPETVFNWGKEVMPVLGNALLKAVRLSTMPVTIKKLIPLIDGLITLLDVPRKEFHTSRWIQETYNGMQSIASILLLAECVKIQITELSAGKDQKVGLRMDAKLLLISFCQSLKTFLDFQCDVSEKTEVVIQGTEATAEREQMCVVLNQLNVLALNLQLFDEKIERPPSSISVLMDKITKMSRILLGKIYGMNFFGDGTNPGSKVSTDLKLAMDKLQSVSGNYVNLLSSSSRPTQNREAYETSHWFEKQKPSSTVESSNKLEVTQAIFHPNFRVAKVGNHIRNQQQSIHTDKPQVVGEPVVVCKKSWNLRMKKTPTKEEEVGNLPKCAALLEGNNQPRILNGRNQRFGRIIPL